MVPLIINESVRAEIKRVKEYAEDHKYNIHHLHRVMKGRERPAGEDPGHCLTIPIGFRVVYSIEQHPVGWCHHWSVSAPDPGRAISKPGLRMILDDFEFVGREPDYTHAEQIGPNHIALNVLIKCEGAPCDEKSK